MKTELQLVVPQSKRTSRINPTIVCKDGFKISVQASNCHYCNPRDNIGPYTHVECGFPSTKPLNPELLEYAEDTEDYTKTIYGYVPEAVVWIEIALHGGIAE